MIQWHLVQNERHIKNLPGLYALYYNRNGENRLAYIGRSKNLHNRLMWYGNTTVHPVLRNLRKDNEGVFIKIKYTDNLKFESRLIGKLKPPINRRYITVQ